MGKKGGGAASSKHQKAKKPSLKAKHSDNFKSLKKSETRQVIVQSEKKKKKLVHQKHKQSHTPDEFRSFDERIAAVRAKRQQQPQAALAAANSVVVAPSFVMPAATFSLNANPINLQQPTREVEGFHGFISALEQPATAPPPSAPRDSRPPRQRTAAPKNVFAVLDDEEDDQPESMQQVPVPSFMQPATFNFQFGGQPNAFAGSTNGLTSLQRSIMGLPRALPGMADIDDDL